MEAVLDRRAGGKIEVPFSDLVLCHSDVGTDWTRMGKGRRDECGLSRLLLGGRNLVNTPFVELARAVKDAYFVETRSDLAWVDERGRIHSLVEKGTDGIYRIEDEDAADPIGVVPLADHRYNLDSGHHRTLALYILDETTPLRATIRER
jgi:hypothetical protein